MQAGIPVGAGGARTGQELLSCKDHLSVPMLAQPTP